MSAVIDNSVQIAAVPAAPPPADHPVKLAIIVPAFVTGPDGDFHPTSESSIALCRGLQALGIVTMTIPDDAFRFDSPSDVAAEVRRQLGVPGGQIRVCVGLVDPHALIGFAFHVAEELPGAEVWTSPRRPGTLAGWIRDNTERKARELGRPITADEMLELGRELLREMVGPLERRWLEPHEAPTLAGV